MSTSKVKVFTPETALRSNVVTQSFMIGSLPSVILIRNSSTFDHLNLEEREFS
jgi:hypothetical protein